MEYIKKDAKRTRKRKMQDETVVKLPSETYRNEKKPTD